MNKRLKDILKVTIFLGLGLFLVWWSVKDLSAADWEEMKAAFREANYFWIVLSLIITLASHFSRALRWRMMLQATGNNPSVGNTMSAVMVNYLANLALPRLGEVMRCGVMKQYENIPLSQSVGTLITERVIDVIFLLSFTVIVFFWQFERVGRFLQEKFGAALGAKVENMTSGSGLIYLGIGFLLFAAVAFWLFKKFQQTALFQRVLETLKGLWEGIISVKNVSNLPLFIFHTFFIWIMYVVMTYVCIFAMDATENVGLGAALAVFVCGGYAILFTQGGIGAYQIIVQAVLILYGVKSNLALAFGWLVWSSQTILVLIGGVIALVALSFLNRSQKVNRSAPSVNQST